MFGFKGHYQARFDIDSPGVVVTANRDFMIQAGHCLKTLATNEKYAIEFDVDNVNVVKPDQFVNNTAITNDGREYVNFYAMTETIWAASIGGINVASGPITNFVNVYTGWRYISNASLSPLNRKVRGSFHRPDLQSYYGLVPILDGTVNVSTNNLCATDPLNMDLTVFPNLKHCIFHGIFATVVNFKFPKRLESFKFTLPGSLLNTITGRLPATITQIILGPLSNVTNIDSLIQDCANTKVLALASQNSTQWTNITHAVTSLSGTLDISFMTSLETFVLPGNSNLNNLILPTTNTWKWVYMVSWNATLRASFNTTRLDEILASPNLRAFLFASCQFVWAKNFTNADFTSTLRGFWIANNSITGNITLTDVKPLLEFRTSNFAARTGTQLNSHPVVTITGLTTCRVIDLTGSDISDLQLPVNTLCSSLSIWDNKLDIATNPNLLSQINAMVGLQTLFIGNQTNPQGGTAIGQDSVNGIGSNPNFSGLLNCLIISISACKASGTLTLYGGAAKMQQLYVAQNALTSIANFSVHTAMNTIVLRDNPDLVISIPGTFTNVTTIVATNTKISSVDLSGKTVTASFGALYFQNCLLLTAITFPTTQARSIIQTGLFLTLSGCNSLATISNTANINYTSSTGTADTRFPADGCAISHVILLGENNFIPRTISLQNNAMSQANIDATINSLYTNRDKWNGYTSLKSLNIAGTNAAPSGVYQAPPGFVLGSNDGTPGNAKEQVYVLVNNRGWSITMN
jgi:hypothetical protein